LEDFKVAEFCAKMDQQNRDELQQNITAMIQKCQLSESESHSWTSFLDSIPKQPSDVQNIEPFCLPSPQDICCYRQFQREPLPLDSGIRQIDVVTHAHFTSRERQKTILAQDIENQKQSKMESLKKGHFVVLQVEVKNCAAYPFDFVIAQVIEDVSGKDTTDPDTLILFQIFRPSTLNNLSSKMIPWIGDTNQAWKDDFERGHVKAVIQLQPQGKKLTAQSRKMIENTFF
jgi:hypothetical protein